MVNERHQWALERFAELEQQEGSQSKAAKKIGMPAGTISMLKSGTYPGNVDAQFEKLIAYFETKSEAAEIASVANVLTYVRTTISGQVYDVIRNCHVQGGLAVACGDAGIGKTKAAKQYQMEHPTNSIYVSLNPCIKSSKSVLSLLSMKVGVTERTISGMWLGLTNKLSDGMIIIVDEAQFLSLQTIESLRTLTDHFSDNDQTLGIIFIGNIDTVNRFDGRKRSEIAQIANRTRQKKVYYTDHVQREDIELLFPALNTESIDFMLAIARSSQAIRGAVNLYNNALDNEDISLEGLIAMAKFMEITV